MKNTVRVHRNGATVRTTSQVQQSRNGSSTQLKTPHTERQVNIVLHEDSGETFASFKLPESAFLKLKADAEAKGISLMEWMMKAVESTFGNARPQLPATPAPAVPLQRSLAEESNQAVWPGASLLNDIDEAKAQNHALHWLLFDAMNREDGGNYGEEIQLGITHLIIQTEDRLDKIFNTIIGQIDKVAS